MAFVNAENGKKATSQICKRMRKRENNELNYFILNGWSVTLQ